MNNLYIITGRTVNPTIRDLIKKSAADRNVNVVEIIVETFDFTKEIVLTENDGLYRITQGLKADLIERTLINDKVATFYKSQRDCLGKVTSKIGSFLVHEKHKLPIIKTVPFITNDKNLLKKYIDYLDGFPIIVKALGGSHGVGVMKIESFESLLSLMDFLSTKEEAFILRKYIDYVEHARLIVIGNKVAGSIEYKRVKDDFRSNAGSELSVFPKQYPELIETIAINSVHTLGFEFGGVDILIDKEGNPFIAEVNFPCYFPRVQMATGIDISGKMIDYLTSKSELNSK